MFKSFEPTILFYIFYNYPFDQVQLDANNELVARGWMYHRETATWYCSELAESSSQSNSGDGAGFSNSHKKKKTYTLTNSASSVK
jgi:CCR4-NOT transcriptional regulation complex NOT5 subunit